MPLPGPRSPEPRGAPPAESAAGRATLRERAVAAGIVVALLSAVIGIRLHLLYEPYTFLMGDCPYYAQTAISIVIDGDLDLANQLKGGLAYHDGHVARGTHGEWYPKHPILMPLATLPLLPLFKMNGFLVFNVLVLIALGLALHALGGLTARPLAAAAGALITILGSFLILYDYNYSPNLFACLLLTVSVLAIVRGRASPGGLFGGLATCAATTNLFVLPILAVYIVWKRRARGLVLFAAAAAIPLLAQGGLNAYMFGSPLVSPYMRILSLDGEREVVRSHMNDFDNPMWEGIGGQITDPRKGLIVTAPILLVAIPGYALWIRRKPDQALLCLSTGVFLFLLFSRYRWWPTSHVGNRFLMPSVALSAPAVACAMQWVFERARVAGLRATEAIGDAAHARQR